LDSPTAKRRAGVVVAETFRPFDACAVRIVIGDDFGSRGENPNVRCLNHLRVRTDEQNRVARFQVRKQYLSDKRAVSPNFGTNVCVSCGLIAFHSTRVVILFHRLERLRFSRPDGNALNFRADVHGGLKRRAGRVHPIVNARRVFAGYTGTQFVANQARQFQQGTPLSRGSQIRFVGDALLVKCQLRRPTSRPHRRAGRDREIIIVRAS